MIQIDQEKSCYMTQLISIKVNQSLTYNKLNTQGLAQMNHSTFLFRPVSLYEMVVN
jgi:hypothetical protein